MHFLKHHNMQQHMKKFKFTLKTHVFIKVAQGDLQKCIIWPKKLGKNKQKWNKAFVNLGLSPRKLNTLVKTRQTFYF